MAKNLATSRSFAERTAPNVRTVRVALPDRKTDPYFCFLLMPRFDTMPIDTNRQIRGQQLEALIRAAKFVYPKAFDIIGFATESGADPSYRSEDLIYLDAASGAPRRTTGGSTREGARLSAPAGARIRI